MKNCKYSLLASALIMTAVAQVSAQAATADYVVQQKFSLGEPTKWDYVAVDTVRNQLFITRGDHVQVVSLPSGKPVAEIANTQGVHGVAFAQDLKLGFTSNGRTNSVTVFDLDTLKVKQEIKISGVNPDAILYDAASKKLFTFNGKSSDVTVIDAVSLTVVATIKTTGRPEFAVADNEGKVFFNVEDKGELHVIDVATNALVSKWKLAGCEEPTGLALDFANSRLFSVCQNNAMIVTDAKTGKKITSVKIGGHPDAVVYDPATATIFSSNGEGNVTIIHQQDANTYKVSSTLITAPGAKTMAMDMQSKAIYLPTVIDKTFTVVVAVPK